MRRLGISLAVAGLVTLGHAAPANAGGDAARGAKEDSREWRADQEGKRSAKPGDDVNLEVDLFARHSARLMEFKT